MKLFVSTSKIELLIILHLDTSTPLKKSFCKDFFE